MNQWKKHCAKAKPVKEKIFLHLKEEELLDNNRVLGVSSWFYT